MAFQYTNPSLTLQESTTLQECLTLQESTTLQALRKWQALINPPRAGVSPEVGGWRNIVGALLLLGLAVVADAQERAISHSSQQWIQVYTQTELNVKNAFWLDVGMRQTHNGRLPSQRLIRLGWAYGLPMQLQGVTGVARFTFQQDGRTNRNEWRLWQEVNRTHVFRTMTLQQRFRAEARFFENIGHGSNPGGRHFNMRYRYRLQASVPIAKFRQDDATSPILLLTVADELFVNTGREIVHNTFDNNRLIVGPALRLNPKLSIALLYNHQYGHRNNRNTAESAEICWLTINWKGQMRTSDKSGRFQ
jgi:hypothetical protein